MTPEQHKQSILAHCLWMAERDPEYAIWAAGWYEANQPQLLANLLANLQAKVRQEIRRASTSGRPSLAEGSPDAAAQCRPLPR